jgi:hypothetical protein
MYIQIFTYIKGESYYTGEFNHNFDSFDEAAEAFVEHVKNLTGENIPLPTKKTLIPRFENDEYNIWFSNVSEFPFNP